MRVVLCCAVFILCAHVSCLGSTDNDLSTEYDEASLPRDDTIQMLSPSSRADGASAGNGVVSLGESTPTLPRDDAIQIMSPSSRAAGE